MPCVGTTFKDACECVLRRVNIESRTNFDLRFALLPFGIRSRLNSWRDVCVDGVLINSALVCLFNIIQCAA